METTTRNATLPDLVALLTEQNARKLDLVVPASKVTARDAHLVVRGSEPLLTEDGVTEGDGTYIPTAVADEGIADKLGIPVSYLRRLREERPDLYDSNVNGWLHGRGGLITNPVRDAEGVFRWADGTPAERGEQRWKRAPLAGDARSFMLRAFRGDEPGSTGIARAFLSDRYRITDNLDVLVSALDGIKEAGIHANVRSADLTDRRMVVKIDAPAVTALAPRLLAGYRSPFSGQSGDDLPIVSAGLRITNSETGGGAYSITPEVTVRVCSNGMTMTKDAVRRIHVGERLEEGVRWGNDTQDKALELIRLQTRDAVQAFLSEDYLTAAVTRLERRAEESVTASESAVRDITRAVKIPEAHLAGIMDYFIRGGQTTLAGVANAITAYSQTIDDGDAAHELDSRAVAILGA